MYERFQTLPKQGDRFYGWREELRLTPVFRFVGAQEEAGAGDGVVHHAPDVAERHGLNRAAYYGLQIRDGNAYGC